MEKSNKKKSTFMVMVLLVFEATVFLLTACGNKVQINEINTIANNENRQERLSMLEEPSIEYEVEKMNSSVLVSQSGYETSCEKVAVLEGSNLPANFQVINADDEKIVFIGNIETRECSEDSDVISGIADFTKYDEPGRYYIKTEILGRSKDFFIVEKDRKDKVRNVFKTIHSYRSSDNNRMYALESSEDVRINAGGGWITDKDGSKDVITGCNTIMDMLLAYELHPTIFDDEFGVADSNNSQVNLIDEIKYEVDWLMRMQNSETGGVYTGVYIPEGKSQLMVGGETTKATAYFCTTLAKLSFDLSKTDSEFSKLCLQAATKAWNCLIANKEIVTQEQMYRAAVEMYRVTGQGTYLGVINDFLSANREMDYESRALLDAALTYMNTTRIVNVSFCTTLMQQFMARTEAKSNAALSSRYYVEPGKSVSELLRNATELIVVDNIISNQEYERIEMGYLHYLSGRNHESIDYTKALDNINEYAQLLVLVTELADKEHEKE